VTTTIAVAGKGGTGKTTIAGLVIEYLKERGATPILAIDADPASNLNSVLGMPLDRTVGDIREETLDKARSGLLEAGVAKSDLLDYEINAHIVEGEGVDLLAMGRPEGPGCYCAANRMLREIVDRIAASYAWVVIDNEAGLEHLSRRTTRDVDELLIVSDASQRGLTTAGRVLELVGELGTRVGRHHLLVNRADAPLTPEMQETIARYGLDLLALLPSDEAVVARDAVGEPIVGLPADAPLRAAVGQIAERVLSASHQRKEPASADHR
jgi:CO dehydrogenase maturation factor